MFNYELTLKDRVVIVSTAERLHRPTVSEVASIALNLNLITVDEMMGAQQARLLPEMRTASVTVPITFDANTTTREMLREMIANMLASAQAADSSWGENYGGFTIGPVCFPDENVKFPAE